VEFTQVFSPFTEERGKLFFGMNSMMKRITFVLLSTLLVLPRLSFAAPFRAVNDLKQLNDYIEDNVADVSADDQDDAEAANDGAELDAEGEKTYKELVEWANTHPEEFQKMIDSQPPEEEQADDEAGDEEVTEDASAYCADPNDPAQFLEAKAKRKAKKRRGKKRGGNRCTAAALKTSISVCCLLFVRTKLGLPSNPRSVHAKDYGSVLSSHGYCTTKVKNNDPTYAPVGAVMIYTGGASGHIELKRGKNAYWWGPTNSVPATKWKKKKRKLRAVYVKCGKKK
jgi:hypothetical protein